MAEMAKVFWPQGKICSAMAQHSEPIPVVNLKEAYTNLLTGKEIGKIVLEEPLEQT